MEMNVIGKAIDQKPTGEDVSHRVGCRPSMWKERRNPHIMISKQQPKYYDKTIWYYIFRRKNSPAIGSPGGDSIR